MSSEIEERAERTSRGARVRAALTGSPALTASMLLLAVVFVAGTIGPPLLGQRTFVAVDLLYEHYPWQNLTDQPDTSPSGWGPVSDTVDGTTPARTIFAESVRDGDPLLWNPWIAGGTSHASTPISGVYNPLTFGYLVLPAHMAPAATKLLELCAAIGFTFLFLRRVGLRRPSAILGGVAFAGSGFMVMWSNWPQPGTAALIPALFWTAERMLQRRTARSVVPVALSVGAILLGGFPMVAVYGLTALGPYVVVRSLWERRGTATAVRAVVADLARFACGLTVGVLLAAFAVVPFQADLGRTDLGYRGTNPGLEMDTLITTVAPAGLGGSWTDVPYFGRTNQVEEVSYLGVATLVLAFVAVWLGRARGVRRGVFVTMLTATVLTVAAIYVGDPVLGVLQQFPFYDSNAIGRARSLLGFLVGVVAALGLDRLLDERAERGRAERSWVPDRGTLLRRGAVLVVSVPVVAVALDAAVDRATAIGRREHLRDELIVAGALGVAALVAAAVITRGHAILRVLGVAGLGAVLVFQSVSFAGPVTPDVDADSFYPEIEDLEWLAEEARASRVAVEGPTLYPSANSVYGIRSVTGHTFHQQSWKELLLTADPTAFAASPTLSRLTNSPEVRSSAALDRLAAEFFVITPRSVIPGFRTMPWPPAPEVGTISLGDGDSVLRPLDEPLPRIRGVSISIVSAEVSTPFDVAPMGRIELIDEDGTVLAHNERRLDRRANDGSFMITVPSEPATSAVGIRFVVTGDAEVELAQARDGLPAMTFLEAVDDGLDLVLAGDIVVFRRAGALERIRWAADTLVETDGDARRALLGGGALPRDTAVLSAPGPDGAGAPAALRVLRDEPEEIDVRVSADGDGYVVIADAIQQGWVAELDGDRVDLVEADHAGVGVFVPEGDHRLSLRYEAPGRRLGFLLTGLGWIVVLALSLAGTLWRRRASTDAAS